jgi:hypothetical protein
MKKMTCFIACFAFTFTAWSQQAVKEVRWKDLSPLPHGAVLVSIDGRTALKIENTNDAPLQVALLTIPKPKISAQMYGLQGEVRHDNVHGDGYLEMWNYFPPDKPALPEGQYFSRTLGDSGEMGKISGTADWRPFSLPFNRTGASGSPTKLQINLILPGRGTVYLGPMKLVQYPAAASETAWWSDRTATLAGSWGGGLLGCLGALIGTLSSMGKGRGFVIPLLKIQGGVGAILGVAGIVAVFQHQPYAVYYPLLLIGIILLPISLGLLPAVERRYQEQELRRMQSLDALG